MKNKALLLAFFIILAPSGLATADQERLGINFSTLWQSKFMWYGQNYFDNHAGVLNTVDFDLYQTGFHAGFISAISGGGRSLNKEGYAYYIKYVDSIFEDSRFKTDYQIRWQYYDFFDNPSDATDLSEFRLNIWLPKLLKSKIIPRYHLSYLYSAKSNSGISAREPEGFMHIFGLNYDLKNISPKIPLNFDWLITYRDGWGGKKYAHDWTHTTFSLSTAMPLGKGTLTPGIHYQISMEDTINTHNEFFTCLTYNISF
jgi:hypothetical protein